jgi:hypothetical protein
LARCSATNPPAGALETPRENRVSNLALAPSGSVPAAFWERVTDLEARIAEGQHAPTLERELEELKEKRVTLTARREALLHFDAVYAKGGLGGWGNDDYERVSGAPNELQTQCRGVSEVATITRQCRHNTISCYCAKTNET